MSLATNSLLSDESVRECSINMEMDHLDLKEGIQLDLGNLSHPRI